MKFRSCILLLILLVVSTISGCSPSRNGPKPTAVSPLQQPASTRTLPPVVPMVTSVPDPEVAALVFLKSWQVEDYEAMYRMLTPASQDAIAMEKFIQRYKDAAIQMTMQKLDLAILSKLTNPSSAQVAYRITFHTKMLGDIPADMTMNLSLEKGEWRVQWDDGLIMPQLHGGNVLYRDMKTPTRGNVYDRSGNAIAAANDVFWLAVIKGKGDPDQEGRMLDVLSRLTGKTPEAIKALYDRDSIYEGDFVPVGYATRDQVMEYYNTLSGLGEGVQFGEYQARYYPDGGIAPHVTGYVQAIPKEKVDEYQRLGYRLDDRVGMAGVEKWGEKYLLGQRGVSLYVNNSQGTPVTRLATVDSQPSQSIYLTIDRKLQLQAQQAIAGFSGAIVVMERDTGRVLAMVSTPGFDPNAFEAIGNTNSYKMVSQYYGDGLKRLYNRASGNGYPLGSVFKIITMAAALESGLFTPEDTLNCQGTFTDIPGETLTDWTYDDGLPPSGILTLPEGLMRSCNPWFYHIGVEMLKAGKPNAISDMAKAFGLGAPTGIQGLDIDEAGNIPYPNADDQSTAARIAIGQATVLVNPLQVARFIAAVGNGGTLYRPQVIEKITDPDGKASFEFKPEEVGKLPVKPENLTIIQDAMREVVTNPRGTAVRAFSGFNIPVYGKTGTAQNDLQGHPHAWFAGYTDTGRTDKPDIAFAVIVEYAGEGADYAAPIARRLLEVYYMGQPQKVYTWESRINVTRTPTPEVTETPAP